MYQKNILIENTDQTNTMGSDIVLSIYKRRFLILYIIFGVISLYVESIVREFFKNYVNESFSSGISILSSIFIAYFLNINFNFKVPKKRLAKSMIYFLIVSLLSVSLQYFFSRITNLDFVTNRYLISGFLFFIAYTFHRKFSFKDNQTTGLAIHLNTDLNLEYIYNKVGNTPDFIHVDLIDSSFNKKNIATDLIMLEAIKKLWPKKRIQLHVMSKDPASWIDKIDIYLEEIFVHLDTDASKLEKVKTENFGIVINHNATIEEINLAVNNYKKIMVLCIEKPGLSGQKFQDQADRTIKLLLDKTYKKNSKVVLDGGMTPHIATKYFVDDIVSASSVLDSKYSKLQITNFQLSKKYK